MSSRTSLMDTDFTADQFTHQPKCTKTQSQNFQGWWLPETDCNPKIQETTNKLSIIKNNEGNLIRIICLEDYWYIFKIPFFWLVYDKALHSLISNPYFNRTFNILFSLTPQKFKTIFFSCSNIFNGKVVNQISTRRICPSLYQNVIQ